MNLSCSVLTTSLGYWTISQGYDDLPRVLDDHLEVLNDLLGVLDDLPGVLGNKGYLHYQRELWRNIFGKNTIYYWRKTRKCDILREQESINAPPPPSSPLPFCDALNLVEDDTHHISDFRPCPVSWMTSGAIQWGVPFIERRMLLLLMLRFWNRIMSQRSGFYYVFHCAFAQYVGYPTCN